MLYIKINGLKPKNAVSKRNLKNRLKGIKNDLPQKTMITLIEKYYK
jgi:hypothetical protein